MATITAPRPRSGSRAALTTEIWHRMPVETWVLGCAVLLWIGLSIASPYFLTSGNIFNIMRQVSIDAIVAYGELFTIITAGIDLSVGSVLGFTGVAFAMLLANGASLVIAAPLTLVLGLAIGIVNGFAVDRLGIPAFIVTLAGLQGYRGLTMLVSGGMTVAGLPDSLGNFANSSIFGIPTMFVVMLAFAAAYGLASLFAAVGGMLLVARLTMGNPNAGMGAELQAIAAAVVGGASLFGGRGTIGGCFIGAILFTTIGNGANLLGVNPFWQMVIEGLLIAGVVYLDNVQKRRAQGQ